MKSVVPIFIIVYKLFSKCEAWLFNPAASTVSYNITTVKSIPPKEDLDPVQYEIGTIIGIIFGVLFGVALISFAGYKYIKQKRERDREYALAAKIKLRSAKNAGVERDKEYRRKEKVKMTAAKLAGVYVDTTTQEKLVHDDDVIFSREEYKSLQKYKIPYEDNSDEEL